MAVLGRYELIREIASGGMASVFLGRVCGEGGFERLVAVKLMNQHIVRNPDFVAMFLDEARLAARIRHPNVVGTLDVQKSSEGMFLVMEYIEGASLHQIRRHLNRDGEQRIPVDIALRIMLDTLAGLHAAHELKGADGAPLRLVHRDLSPQNLLVGADGVSRITDFGVAHAEARLSATRTGELKGKVPYMPPEQVTGERVDRRADVYAAGAVLWEALVGKRLFRADNDAALLHAILCGPAASPRERNPLVPEGVDRACMRALALKAADRFQSAKELADALDDSAAEAGMRIAKHDAVSTYVKQLLPLIEPQTSDRTPTSLRAFSTPHASTDLSPAVDGHVGVPRSGSGPTQIEAVLHQTGSPSSSYSKLVMAGLAAIAVVAVAIAIAVGAASDSDPGLQTSQAAAAAAAVPAVSTTAATAATVATAPTSASPAEDASAPIAAGSPSAAGSGDAASSRPGSVEGPSKSAPEAARPKTSKSAKPSATSFDPEDL